MCFTCTCSRWNVVSCWADCHLGQCRAPTQANWPGRTGSVRAERTLALARTSKLIAESRREGGCVGLRSGRHSRPRVRINPIVRVRKKGAQDVRGWFSSYSFWPDRLTHACDVGTGRAFYQSARGTAAEATGRYPVPGGRTWSPAPHNECEAFPAGSAVAGPSPGRSYPLKVRHHRLPSTVSNNLGQCPHVEES